MSQFSRRLQRSTNVSVVANQPPSAPSNLVITPSETSLALSWTAATDPDGTVASYQVRVNGTLNGSPTSTTYNVTGLTASTAYTITVRAIDNLGLAGSDVSGSGTTSAGGAITHGEQITLANTGYTAYYDSTLGRNLQIGDLEVVSGNHWISDYLSVGGTLSKKHFTGGITIDVDDVTLRGCLFDYPVSGYLNGVSATGWTLDYCTIDPATPGDQATYYHGYTANRCQLIGCSDGAKANGSNTIFIESYIRTKQQSALDHNDGIQNVGGSGAVQVIRCNIDARPEGSADVGNAALFFADGEIGLHTVHDNLLAGGGYTLAMYDGGTFNVQGNKFVRGSFQYATHGMAGPGSGPQNVTWGTLRANTYSDNGQVIPL